MSESRPRGPLGLLGAVLVVVLGALGYLQLGDKDPAGSGTQTAQQPTATQTTDATATRTAWVDGPSGRIDIAPTLERIERGERHAHRNDGSVFQNRERRLPIKPRGYYREYVHPTPGQRGPGAQRVVIGEDRDVHYTPDHYRSFQVVEWTFRAFPR